MRMSPYHRSAALLIAALSPIAALADGAATPPPVIVVPCKPPQPSVISPIVAAPLSLAPLVPDGKGGWIPNPIYRSVLISPGNGSGTASAAGGTRPTEDPADAQKGPAPASADPSGTPAPRKTLKPLEAIPPAPNPILPRSSGVRVEPSQDSPGLKFTIPGT